MSLWTCHSLDCIFAKKSFLQLKKSQIAGRNYTKKLLPNPGLNWPLVNALRWVTTNRPYFLHLHLELDSYHFLSVLLIILLYINSKYCHFWGKLIICLILSSSSCCIVYEGKNKELAQNRRLIGSCQLFSCHASGAVWLTQYLRNWVNTFFKQM